MNTRKAVVLRTLIGALLALVFVTGTARSEIRTGSYIGDSTAGRSITGLGFQPDVVIIKADAVAEGVLASATMPAGTAKVLTADLALLANLVISLDADGFTLGSDTRVNSSSVTYYYAAFGKDDNISLGTYTGTGGANMVSGLGFSPDYIIVMKDGASRAVQYAYHAFESSSFTQNNYTDAILSMDADGFSLGTNTNANENARTYHYVAWNEVPQRVMLGWYFGDGSDNRDITLGFRPEYLIVKSISTDNPVQRFAPMTGDRSVNFQDALQADRIQAFSGNGFQIGTDGSVNNNPNSYWYVAFANGGSLQLGTGETPGEITVTAPNYFDLKFSTASGGGIQEFHDLAAGPNNFFDLAGGVGSIDALFFDTISPSGTWYNVAENDIDSRLELLEATPTRVRVRQEAFYQEEGGTALLSGVKGFGDYSVYPSGRVALRWERRTTKPVTLFRQQMGLSVHRDSPVGQPLSTWAPYFGPSDEFVLTQIHDLTYGTYTDFLQILYRDWSMAAGHVQDADSTQWFVSGAPENWGVLLWDEINGQTVPPVERWDSIIDFKPTDFADDTDPKVLVRRDDYRGPDVLSFTVGQPWVENPVDGDHYNESEAAYTVDMEPGVGLKVSMNGSTKTRHQPFFKIRQWRSLDDPIAVSLDGVPLLNDTDFKADVKPVARAHFADDLLWHSTFEDAAALSAPDVGSPAAVAGGTAFVAARYGKGAVFAAPTDYASFPVAGDLLPDRGAVELWYRPSYFYLDGSAHRIWTYFVDPNNQFRLNKTPADNLEFDIVHGGTVTRVQLQPAAYGWLDEEWIHLRVSWDAGAPLGDQVRIFVNGLEPPHLDPAMPYPGGVPANGTFYVGSNEGPAPTLSATGLIDELRIYGAPMAPRPLAHGGLAANPDEYLATGTRNYTMPFNVLDGRRRGEYFYVGSDAPFRGLNVMLAAKGEGAVDLDWEFWDGQRWSNLESVAGFKDETVHLTRDGAVYWGADPPGWVEYSVNGSTDLFFVRAHLQSGSYFTFPTERVIKTDILLFQYLGNVTGVAETFDFGPPPAIDVQISSALNQSFVVGTPAVTAATVTITDNGGGGITAAQDLRIRIPAGFFMRWDETVLNALLAGSAAAKVSPGIKAYEDNGRTVVLDVTADFAAGDQLAVDGLQFFSFTAPSPLDNLELEVQNDDAVSALDDKTIVITPDGSPNLSSDDNQVFSVGQPPTLAAPIFVTEGVAGASFTTANDIRIHVPASLSMQWDSSITTVSVSGTAFAKVTTAVTYEDGNRTVVIDVTNPFAPGEFISITGLQFSSFTAAGPPDNLWLEVDNAGTLEDKDDKTLEITASADVLFFTATATDGQVELEWINPTFGTCVDIVIVRNTTKPTGPSDGVNVATLSCFGELGFKKNVTDGGVTNGTTYHYGIFVYDGISAYTPGRFLTARPFVTSGPAKWAYSTGATTMAPPSVRFKAGTAYVYAVSNDSILHAMNGGLGVNAGIWPSGWTPFKTGGPIQSRPPVLPFQVGAATDGVALLGSQDGNVYAVDAATGLQEWAQTIASMVLAAPAGNFTGFNATAHDIVVTGTRNSAGANSLEALDVDTGAPVWSFSNTSAQGGDNLPIGIISGGAAIDYNNHLVYFGSRKKSGGTPNTIWCVDFSSGSPVLSWAKPIGDVDGSPVLMGGVVYVGTNAGDVYALDAGSGNVNWTFALADGPVKGFPFPQFGTNNIFVSTSTKIWSLADGGTSSTVNPNWPVTSIPSPSTPLYVPGSNNVLVGSSNGNLYQIDILNPATPKLVTLGGGTGAIGAPTLDLLNSMIYVGSDEGNVHAVFYPIP